MKERRNRLENRLGRKMEANLHGGDEKIHGWNPRSPWESFGEAHGLEEREKEDEPFGKKGLGYIPVKTGQAGLLNRSGRCMP